MVANDVILLADMVEREKANVDSRLTPPQQEAYFASKHYLQDYQPSHDDLMAGIVDGTRDGGLDAVYIFANGLCVRDDTPLDKLGRHVSLDLCLLQVKNATGFKEDAIDKLIVGLPSLLNFGRDEQALARQYNERVVEITRRFLSAYRNLELPLLRIYVAFASLRAEEVHVNTQEKADRLVEVLTGCFGSGKTSVEFLTATKLADMARERPKVTRSLALAENAISTNTAGGYIGVVKLADYERFITAETGELDHALFEANVRDYEGDVSVDRSIEQTLSVADKEVDFWWLNNGVTIVASRVQPSNKLLQLDSPQIVNGLQTSNEIYKRSRQAAYDSDERAVLVKVIEARTDEVRDRIIRATNSQTSLGPSALRATDKVQRQVEEHLRKEGLFYERRRRHYHNQGLPADKIVSIDRMAQAILATLAQAPHVARGEISRLFEREYYDLLFTPSHPIQMYASCIGLLRDAERFLREATKIGPAAEDYVFHLTMLSAMASTRKNRPSASDIASSRPLSRTTYHHLFGIVQDEFERFGRRTNTLLLDQIAKNDKVTSSVLEKGRTYLLTSSRN